MPDDVDVGGIAAEIAKFLRRDEERQQRGFCRRDRPFRFIAIEEGLGQPPVAAAIFVRPGKARDILQVVRLAAGVEVEDADMAVGIDEGIEDMDVAMNRAEAGDIGIDRIERLGNRLGGRG